ncbi:hypothetical protein BDW74DRAFT_172011 [Aspergillus multicolor]|uniref:uncharacterized protein n=1 Tax=Aspergillus multicolor TaxID=41759 RepID=UPI003CCCC8AE
MADPFSLLSGAAGVVSLGLTVCQGLVAYYGSFTAFSSETESFLTRVKGLSATLELLQSRLNRLQGPLNPYITDELQLSEHFDINPLYADITNERLYETKSVYWAVRYNHRAADILYTAGFQELNELDDEGLSPLLRLSLPLWYQDRGCSLLATSPEAWFRPIHVIAHSIGFEMFSDKEAPDGPLPEDRARQIAKSLVTPLVHYPDVLRLLLTDTHHRDRCVCACSPDDCLPITIIPTWYSKTKDRGNPLLLGQIVGGILDTHREFELDDGSLASVVIRSCTFNTLGIRHICRGHVSTYPELGDIELEDVEEVQEKDGFLFEELGELVSEFLEKFDELGSLCRSS